MKTEDARDKSVECLMEIVIHRAYQSTINDLKTMLSDGPPGRRPSENKVKLNNWYQQLTSIDQDNVHELVTQAVDDAIFGVFAILDGVSGGYPLPNTLSDFALYLQTYDSEAAALQDEPVKRTKLNPWDATSDLHDMFRWQLEESQQGDNAQ